MNKDETCMSSGLTINNNPVIMGPTVTVNTSTGGNTTSADRSDNHRRQEGIDASGLQGILSGIGGLMNIIGRI